MSIENGRTMILTHNIILLFLFCVTNTWAHSEVESEYNDLNEGGYKVKLLDSDDVYMKLFKYNLSGSAKVRIQLYYECLCPYSVDFAVNELAPVIETMNSYLDIQTYPFGNAKMVDHNGKISFRCQHGPAECYGNKLHGCTLDQLQHTTALKYNICLMNRKDGSKSDDESAERCGQSMSIDSESIKECAKGTKGTEILQYFGEESKKANFSYVPYVLINGKVFDGDDFKKAVCDTFSKPPPACK